MASASRRPEAPRRNRQVRPQEGPRQDLSRILYRRKMGFAVPLERWFRDPCANGCAAARESVAERNGNLRSRRLKRMVNLHLAGRRDYGRGSGPRVLEGFQAPRRCQPAGSDLLECPIVMLKVLTLPACFQRRRTRHGVFVEERLPAAGDRQWMRKSRASALVSSRCQHSEVCQPTRASRRRNPPQQDDPSSRYPTIPKIRRDGRPPLMARPAPLRQPPVHPCRASGDRRRFPLPGRRRRRSIGRALGCRSS